MKAERTILDEKWNQLWNHTGTVIKWT